MVIHGEPPPWRKASKFVGPRLDFEGSLYDDYDLTEPPVNFNLDDEIATRTEELLQEMYKKTVSLLRQHHAALLKTVKVCAGSNAPLSDCSKLEIASSTTPPLKTLSRLY